MAEKSDYRVAAFAVEELLVDRWSPRAMSGQGIETDELLTLFEAARWAPSSYNAQPWRFLYAMRESAAWKDYFELLDGFNQGWARNAAVLVIVASMTKFPWNDKPSRTHSFDAGAAWQNFALQGSKMGLVTHAMEGFDYEQAHRIGELPETLAVEAMIAVGHPAPITILDEELRSEERPSDRRPLDEFVFDGVYRRDQT